MINALKRSVFRQVLLFALFCFVFAVNGAMARGATNLAVPVIVSPTDKEALVYYPFYLKWDPVEGATGYQVERNVVNSSDSTTNWSNYYENVLDTKAYISTLGTTNSKFGIRIRATVDNGKVFGSWSDYLYYQYGERPVFKSPTDDVGTNCAGYIDVWYRSFYCPAVKSMITKGIIKEARNTLGELKPNGMVMRIEALLDMARLSNSFYKEIQSKEKEKLDLGFSDIDNSVWYAPYLKVFMDHGIINGYADHLFRPYEPINRAEFIVVLLRTAKVDVSNCRNNFFVDVSEKVWFAPYVCYAKEHGIIENDGENKFYPSSVITVQESAHYMFKALETGLF